MAPARGWCRPRPSVTSSVWLTVCEYQAVRAPGVNRTALILTRDGSVDCATGSRYTSPVNHSAGPFCGGLRRRHEVAVGQAGLAVRVFMVT